MQNEAQTTDPANAGGDSPDHWSLIRDIGVLQVKLVVDGIRDLVLVPVSIVVGIISLIRLNNSTGHEFYELLRMGKRSERWINLFGAADKAPVREIDDEDFPDEDIDTMVSRVESFVIDEYRKGGVTKQAKESLDRAIASLHNLANSKRTGKKDPGQAD